MSTEYSRTRQPNPNTPQYLCVTNVRIVEARSVNEDDTAILIFGMRNDIMGDRLRHGIQVISHTRNIFVRSIVDELLVRSQPVKIVEQIRAYGTLPDSSWTHDSGKSIKCQISKARPAGTYGMITSVG
jgi:hypothetical protein